MQNGPGYSRENFLQPCNGGVDNFIKKSRGYSKFLGRPSLLHSTAETAFVRVVTRVVAERRYALETLILLITMNSKHGLRVDGRFLVLLVERL